MSKRYIYYTTSISHWLQGEIEVFAHRLAQTKGRGEVQIDVVRKIPRNPVLTTDDEGDVVFDWDWFSQFFDHERYQGVIFNFTPYYRKKWGIKSGTPGKVINGSRNPDSTLIPMYWLCCEKGEMAKGYEHVTVTGADGIEIPYSECQRLNDHEHGHFDEDVDNEFGDVLTQNSVHITDYQLKQIHRYHLMVDYRGQALKELLNRIINRVFVLAKRIL